MAVKRHGPCHKCQRIKDNGDCSGCAIYKLECEINEIESREGGRLRTIVGIIRDLGHPRVDVRGIMAKSGITPDHIVGGQKVFSATTFQRIKVAVISEANKQTVAI